MATVALIAVVAYLVGAVPFGYLVGRLRGVDLFNAGSGNIGATNAGRVLGRKVGTLVFVLDFLKGAVPVAVAEPAARATDPAALTLLDASDTLRVVAALCAFLGHLFPVYLGFRGGKGVATGAGAVAVLVPGPTAVAALVWVVAVLATQYVSLASVLAAVGLVVARLASVPSPFGPTNWVVTTFLVAAAGLVVVKHHGNVRRLLAGTENRTGDGPMRQTLLRTLHVLALGLWFGGAAFFNFVTAPTIFASFKEVVDGGPSDRTAHVRIIDEQSDKKGDLASALAGAAVGPVFPKYFLTQAACGLVALVTAAAWFRAGGAVHRWRAYLLALAVLTVAVGWPLSSHVSRLRVERFSPDPSVASAARERFGPWHLVSLALSGATTLLAGAGLALAARLPEPHRG